MQNTRLFVDGTEVGGGTPATIASINCALPDNRRFYIGAYRGTGEHRFAGDVDEVQLHNRALGAAEISALYVASR